MIFWTFQKDYGGVKFNIKFGIELFCISLHRLHLMKTCICNFFALDVKKKLWNGETNESQTKRILWTPNKKFMKSILSFLFKQILIFYSCGLDVCTTYTYTCWSRCGSSMRRRRNAYKTIQASAPHHVSIPQNSIAVQKGRERGEASASGNEFSRISDEKSSQWILFYYMNLRYRNITFW